MVVAKHDDVRDLEVFDRELHRRAGPVIVRVGFIRRHQIGDVAHDEQFTRRRTQYRPWIDPGIATADDHRPGSLPFPSHRLEPGPVRFEVDRAKRPVFLDKAVDRRHDHPSAAL